MMLSFMAGKTLSGKSLLGRNAEAHLAMLMHDPILFDQAPVARAWRSAAVLGLH
jgi:hypothetical protein